MVENWVASLGVFSCPQRQVEDSGGFVNASIPVSAQNDSTEVGSQLNITLFVFRLGDVGCLIGSEKQ
jgi:hypothetical protein